MPEKETPEQEPTAVVDKDNNDSTSDEPDIGKVDDEKLKDYDEDTQKVIKGFRKTTQRRLKL